MYTSVADRLENHAFACLAYGVIGDAMGTPTENLEPAEIEARFGWVEFLRRRRNRRYHHAGLARGRADSNRRLC